jgi:hypothetical protein
MKTLKKEDLAQWLVNQHDDCGKDTYFTESHPRTDVQLTTDQSFKRFMKENTKDDLISLIYNHSDEGQEFLESNGLVDKL